MKSSVLLALLPAAVLAYSDIKDGSLKSHNQYRTEHAAPALKWSEEAARVAQAHADKCQYGHSNNNEYGENIAAGYDSIEKAITAWGDERDKYDFGNQGFSSECGHFTQIVWKDTTTVGCGAALCDGLLGNGKQWFHVCNYHTAGNVQGQYEKNVSPKTSGYKQKPVEEDDDKKSKKSKPSKKPQFEYEDKPAKKPTQEPSYADAEPDYETDTDNDVYSDNDSDSDDEYDSDDYSHKKWKPAHKKWNSRNKWNPYKHNKYSKFNKWNSKKWSPKKYGFPKKHVYGKYNSGKWGYDSSPKSDSYDNGKWDNGKYDSY